MGADSRVLAAVGNGLLDELLSGCVETLGSCAAVYESHGDRVIGHETAGWCRALDRASRESCGTADDREALATGRWHCRNSLCSGSKRVIETGNPDDEACLGGLRLFAAPIVADGEVVGALSVGHDAPPRDPYALEKVARRYGLPMGELRKIACAQPARPRVTFDVEKRQVVGIAKLIGAIVERDAVETVLQERSARLRRVNRSLRLLSTVRRIRVRAEREQGLIRDVTDLLELPGGYANVRVEFADDAEAPSGGSSKVADVAICSAAPCLCSEDVEDGRVRAAAIFACPLERSGRAFAALVVESKESGRLDEEEQEMLTEIAAELAEGISVLRDRNEADDALQKSENRARLLLESTEEAIFALDLEGRCSFANPACVRMLGYDSREDLLGHEMHALIHHTQSDGTPYPADACQLHQAFRRGEAANVDGELLWRADGTSFLAGLRCRPLTVAGQRCGGVVTLSDITQSLRNQEQLRRAQKLEALGTLAGGIAHDFNNILTPILAYAELARESLAEGEELYADLEQIEAAAQRAADLVHQILTFSRQREEEVEPVQLGPIVEQALGLLRAALPRSIEIRCSLASSAAYVTANAGQLHQVVLNLCTNAGQAMEKGLLEVSTADVDLSVDAAHQPADLLAGRYVRLRVRDTGRGIPSGMRERIFDPYFTTKPLGPGTGLGLAVVEGIVASAGGGIDVSSAPGAGTTFDVYFPANPAPLEVAVDRSEVSPEGHESLLFVDDEDPIRDVVGKALSRFGYDVELCSSARDVLERLRAEPERYALLVTDLTMPGMNGMELTRRVKRLRPGLPVVMCTGFLPSLNARKAFAIGVQELCQKPITPRALACCVRRVLDGTAASG